MWKERLWQVFLVAILGLTLTMCSRSGGNNNTSSSSNANAEETSTVSVSSMPSLTVKSLPSMTITMDNSSATPVAVTSLPTITVDNSTVAPVAVTTLPVVILDNSSTFSVSVVNAGPSNISGVMACGGFRTYSASGSYYIECDASDSTALSSIGGYLNSIFHDTAFSNGWKLVEVSVSTEPSSNLVHGLFIFHK